MADYKIAIGKVLLIEGGYANDPLDNGGETYKGVSRKNWSKWTGWLIIDNQKTLSNFPENLKGIIRLNELVIEFYEDNFWDPIGGDAIKNQSIANMLVKSAVHEGIVPAIKRAQGIVHITLTGVITNELVEKLNLMS